MALSEAQRAQARGLPWLATVPNGIRVDSFPYQPRKGDHWMWLGRFSAEKAHAVAYAAALEDARDIPAGVQPLARRSGASSAWAVRAEPDGPAEVAGGGR
ncbi:MAG TPA: hypothetical protein VEL73_00915 [Mycobacteriales bacterium]|nr:hypothetical protein [Mycobacteriales bacterium]